MDKMFQGILTMYIFLSEHRALFDLKIHLLLLLFVLKVHNFNNKCPLRIYVKYLKCITY